MTPLTLGTAGHIDHGKTALVAALTGVDTDRLPEERARGISIALGYAPLALPSGRSLSVVDVPGHERFVRTMVAGASGIDLALVVVAADDGVMPQTVEHVAVLRALDVAAGAVAVTKADVADPVRAHREVARLLPGWPVVACSSATGSGLDDLRRVLDAAAASVISRPAAGPPVLHVDRVFAVAGAGVVVTGTLWSGTLRRGDTLALVGGGRPNVATGPSRGGGEGGGAGSVAAAARRAGGVAVRVRSLHVHDQAVEAAPAGQRVAAALTGVRLRDVARGAVLCAPGALLPTRVLDCALALREDARHGERVQVHHGTRGVPGRIVHLGDDLWQVRCEAPLAARDGDRLVVRRLAPPDTLGGGTVLDASARRHGRRPELLDTLRRRRDGVPAPPPPKADVGSSAPERPGRTFTVEDEAALRDAGAGLLAEPELGAGLRDAGVAVRVSGRLYAHREVAAAVRATLEALIAREGAATLATLRDALGTGRKGAQAWLEHFDAERVTRRLPDDRRVLRSPRTSRDGLARRVRGGTSVDEVGS